jgi:hypothetical protein
MRLVQEQRVTRIFRLRPTTVYTRVTQHELQEAASIFDKTGS